MTTKTPFSVYLDPELMEALAERMKQRGEIMRERMDRMQRERPRQ